MIDKNSVYNGDCLELMKQLPDKCIDLVLTDPPYGINCDGGTYGLGVAPKKMTKKSWDIVTVKTTMDKTTNNKVEPKYVFTSKRSDYLTPNCLVDRILSKINQKKFYLDCCCSFKNIPAEKHFIEGESNGLVESWRSPVFNEDRCDWAYCNPRYDECSRWVKKAYIEQQRGNKSVLLIPVRTETKYWHDYILFNDKVEIDWLKKGYKFLHPETKKEMGVFKNALAIVYFKNKKDFL